ncbi:MAG: TrmH family RNA methyltransferase [Marmoricola sp.]
MSDGTPLLTVKSRRVKEARRLLRRRDRVEQGLFLADGPKAVEGALALEGCVQEVFATPAALATYADLLAGTRPVLVDDRAVAAVSDSVTPAGLVAVCRPIDRPLPAVLDVAGGSADTLAICAEVRDPGNAGTIIRTADAVAAGGVVLAGDSVDPYNPKTVRASVGSLFHVPLALERDPAAAVRAVRAAGFVVLAADGAGEHDLFASADLLRGRVAWLFGNEAHGLPPELADLADHRVAIPIPGRAESLNLATAAAVCLYAGLRARS